MRVLVLPVGAVVTAAMVTLLKHASHVDQSSCIVLKQRVLAAGRRTGAGRVVILFFYPMMQSMG